MSTYFLRLLFIAGRHTNILKPQRGDMFIAGRHANILKPQRGDMFIARSIHQTQQSPRGATCDSAIREDYLTQGRKAAKTLRKRGGI